MNMATIFAESQQLPHIPKVVQELIESFRDDNANADDISRKVALDQALTAKVLRLANSAHYGLSRTVSNPQDAVVLLGLSTLRTMVLASGVTSAMKAPVGFDQKTFWRDSFAVASLAKWLARYMPDGDKETAFTCGMLHSIGLMLIHIVLPDDAANVNESVHLGGNRHTAETARLGFTSADVGTELAKRWKFPEEIQQAIQDQNNPDLDQPFSNLGGLIYIAKYLHTAHQNDLTEEELVEKFPVRVARHIGLDLRQIRAAVAECRDLESGFEDILND
jgi:HD-like signal output (HDOD) protein